MLSCTAESVRIDTFACTIACAVLCKYRLRPVHSLCLLYVWHAEQMLPLPCGLQHALSRTQSTSTKALHQLQLVPIVLQFAQQIDSGLLTDAVPVY